MQNTIVLEDPIHGPTQITYTKFRRQKNHKTWICTEIRNGSYLYKIGDQVMMTPISLDYEELTGKISEIKYDQKTFGRITLAVAIFTMDSQGKKTTRTYDGIWHP